MAASPDGYYVVNLGGATTNADQGADATVRLKSQLGCPGVLPPFGGIERVLRHGWVRIIGG